MFDTYTAAWLVEDASQEDKPAERGRSSLKGLCQRFLQIELAALLEVVLVWAGQVHDAAPPLLLISLPC